MERRTVIAGSCIALAASVSGCLTDDGTSDGGTDTDPPDQGNEASVTTSGDDSTTTTTPANNGGTDRVEDSMIILRNTTASEITVHLTVSAANDTLVDSDFKIGPEDQQAADSGITDTGQYEVSITVEDGPTTSRSFSIDNYDVQNGSNIIAEIDEDDIILLIEE